MLVAFGSLGVANMLEGGSFGALVSLPAALIVFGGTFGAAMVTQPLRQTLTAPMLLKHAIFSRPADPLVALETLTRLARIARREGVLALEGELHAVDDAFIRRGVQLVVDGTDPEVARAIMEIEIDSLIDRHASASKYYTTLGGLAPTIGVLGTVMGLVHMLSNLSDPGSMGPAIATAFLATLYGVGSANLVYLPIGQKLQMRSEEEQFVRRMVAVGVEGLQAGDSPIILAERLKAFLSPTEREAANRALEAEAQGGGAGESARAA